MTRLRVAVLRGGPSAEHEISLQTGASVLAALDAELYEPTDIIIAKTGNWYKSGYELLPGKAIEGADVVFNALHGAYGEDGALQRELDRYSIPYTGSGAFASSVAMNKLHAKDRLKNLGIKMAPHMRIKHDDSNDYNRIASSIEDMFGPKYVIKPLAGGSSINTIVASGVYELAKVLEELAKTEEVVLVEKYIQGTEATCGVIENFRNQEFYSLPAIEIVPPSDRPCFDYQSKYDGRTTEICPGRFEGQTKKEIERLAAVIHEELGLSQYSRSDFIVAEDGIYFLEINTLPGLSKESLMPRALAAVGATYEEFVSHLINDSLNRRRFK